MPLSERGVNSFQNLWNILTGLCRCLTSLLSGIAIDRPCVPLLSALERTSSNDPIVGNALVKRTVFSDTFCGQNVSNTPFLLLARMWSHHCYEHWLRKAEDKLFFINDEHFESPYWIPGKFEENLPDDLRPYSSPAETPRASTSKLTVTGTKSGAFGANFDSKSESEPLVTKKSQISNSQIQVTLWNIPYLAP